MARHISYWTEFEEGKIYNYKTYSFDGNKVLYEENLKPLFGYSQRGAGKVDKFFINPKSWEGYHKKNGITFPDSVRKKVGDKRCRYVLCEREIIFYDINGIEFDRKKEYYQYDKTFDIFVFQRGRKIKPLRKNKTFVTKTLYTGLSKDSEGNERVILYPGACHYYNKDNEPKNCFIEFEGRPNEVKIKSIKSLTIKEC